MRESILRMLQAFVQNFGRPPYDLGNDDKIHETDRNVEELQSKRRELERRMRLLEIQGTPRGMNG